VSDAPVTTVRSLPPGTRLGRYRVVKKIGMGGMAELYLALADGASGFEKLVVLKLLHSHMSGDRKLAQMLLKEARVAATLDHPNIASVIDVGTEEGEHYLVMEYVHGRDVRAIQERWPRGEPLPLACALEIVRCACQGLHYAHTKSDLDGKPLGIVHRDVSPSNVLVSYGGAVALVDFGIAKVGGKASTTQTGVLKGKFGYMSPEQSMSATVDCRSDVFALGILLYELTTGRRAFVGPNPFAIMNKAIAGDYVPPERIRADYPARLASIVARAMQPDPAARYQSAAEMQADLDAFAVDSRLRLGEQVLRELMDGLFGSPPFPVVTDLPDSMATAKVIGVAPTITPSRRWSRWVSGIAVVGVAALAGWWVGASRDASTAVVDPSRADADASPPDESVVLEAARVIDEPAPDAAPAASVTPAVASPSDDSVEKQPARARRRAANKPRRARRDESARPSDPARDRHEGMLPPSMQ
jgi:serine/threonine protein kinase